MDDVAVLSRSLWDVTGLAHDECRRLGDNACARRVRVPAADSIQGHQWVGSHLLPREFWPIGDFNTYATRWEQRYSVLTPTRSRLNFVPVVSDKSRLAYNVPAQLGGKWSAFPVIAHYGSAKVTDIIVLKKFATTVVSNGRRAALERLLDQGIEAYVEEGYPPYGDWGSFSDWNNIGPNYFTVLTDPDGRILACLDAYGSEPGLESEDPLSYLAIGSAVVKLATAGGKVVFRMVSQRAARKAAQKAAARAATSELKTLSIEELKTIRGGASSGKPPLISAADLNKAVPQIKPGMGPKLMLNHAEKSGVRQILNVLERIRANPKDLSAWKDIGNRVVKKMQYGTYARDGWMEIYVLEGNPGWASRIRVIFRVAKGDLEAKLVQMH
jgi:hypothetical protein